MTADKKIKVLVLTPNLRVSNGVASLLMNYYRQLDHEKIQMDFALYKDVSTPYYSELQEHGSNCYILPPVKKLLKHRQACAKILREGQYDIVHDNTLLISYPMMKEAEKQNIPVRILHSHGTKLGETRYKEIRNGLFAPLLVRCANHFAACGEDAGKGLFGTQTFSVLPNVIYAVKYEFDPNVREEVRSRLQVEKNEIVILMVARKTPMKNPFFAVDTMKYLQEQGLNIRCWWIGTGPLDAKVEEYAGQQGVKDIIRFLGNRTDVEKFYQGADVFFLPSHFEGLPISLLEAQASGLPCVVSTEVTREAAYTDLVEYVPLADPHEIWLEAFEKQIIRIPQRRSYTEELLNSQFSDTSARQNIESMYLNMLEERL